MGVRLYTLTSPLHNEVELNVSEETFINDIRNFLEEDFIFRLDDYSDWDAPGTKLLYVRTGGTEGLFKKLGLKGDIRILTSGKSNSLAASMEILSWLRSRGRKGEILHGNPGEIAEKILSGAAFKDYDSPFIHPLGNMDLGGIRLGVIGKPSDWLISSDVDYSVARRKLNVELIDIDINELIDSIEGDELESFKGSEAIYDALKGIIRRYSLNGITLRCFDLLDTVRNTGCLALARLNAEGIPSSCEGDIPALLSMAVKKRPCFQCNLSRINGDELLFAHCTIPLNMVSAFRYDTHFESGIGTAIKGELPEGEVEIFKISPDLESYVSIPGRIVRNLSEKGLCRTQITVKAPGAADYMLNSPLANHHIISYLCPSSAL